MNKFLETLSKEERMQRREVIYHLDFIPLYSQSLVFLPFSGPTEETKAVRRAYVRKVANEQRERIE